MATPGMMPPPPPDQGSGQGPGGAPPPPSNQDTAGGGSSMADFARLSMTAQKLADQYPEVAPMVREIQNQVRMATMKVIQQHSASQQQTPPI